jgi:hypothetical protein
VVVQAWLKGFKTPRVEITCLKRRREAGFLSIDPKAIRSLNMTHQLGLL